MPTDVPTQGPTWGRTWSPTAGPTTAPTWGPTDGPGRVTPSTPPTTVYYRNCDEVRAAGKAPLYRGDPGYSRELDRNGDGVACGDRGNS
ncbi:excalibur calcium-binding domain-containing protein [Kribbella solani]|uniref:excalibur calcium-binding domain-containing protein n=1 Tax=Kribbella solani TaxID=236067 RepID=UPI0029B81273|nr:excalibur calcium-binding domain-containing protein [Kribbella solani]MDX2969501.1 excalibur calcium-binding domain-containing protein [Kribbella solani]MDX3006103.1 excalibur calcium-binding domain-containing protein [Kribbella solani]